MQFELPRTVWVYVCATAIIFSGLFFTTPLFAATLYIDPAETTLFRGDTVTVAVRIDTDENECINTADVVLEYDSSVRAVDVSRGDSILNIWVEDPKINEEEHTISFAGGIPGGYCGRISGDPKLTNVLAELVFRLPGLSIGGGSDNNIAKVEFNESSQVLLHDGLGTRAPLKLRGATLSLSDLPGQAKSDDWTIRVQDDTTAPSDFAIVLSQDEQAFSNKYFITFNSHDKQSGIAHYEVMEEPFTEFNLFKWGRADAPWTKVTSPYVLVDQTLNSTIRVKAVDKASNETFAIYVPDAALRKVSMQRIVTFTVIGTVALLVIAGVVYALYRRREDVVEEYEHNNEK